MAIEIWERFPSRAGAAALGDSTSELLYEVSGTDDDLAAYNAILAGVPGLKADPLSTLLLVRRNIQLEQVGPELWEARIRYGHPDDEESQEPPDTGDGSYSFDTGGGTQHITQSLGTTKYPSASSPDFGGAIGVAGDKVEGVDITVPALRFTRTHYLPDATVTLAYVKTLANLTGRTNSGAFYGFAAGELLFTGASGTRRGRGDWEVTFNFEFSENATGIQVGDFVVASKKGWEYLWVYYRTEEDGGARSLVQKPFAAYVEKVYPEGNFADLGIGT
jgi:hypothetical protein